MPHSITDGADYTPPICRVWVAFWYQFCRVVLLSFLRLAAAVIPYYTIYRSEIVEFFDFGAVFQFYGHTGKGSKMSYD